MLKKLLLTVALVGVSISSYGQGQVTFITRPNTSQQVYNSAGVLASGVAYYVQLFAADGFGQAESSLAAVGTQINFRTGLNAGYVQETGAVTSQGNTVNSVVTVTPVANGPVTLQMRAWSSAFTTYAAAVAGGGEYGASALFNVTSGTAPNQPASLSGLQGFTMVPEPSTFALGALGIGALLMVRRRKV